MEHSDGIESTRTSHVYAMINFLHDDIHIYCPYRKNNISLLIISVDTNRMNHITNIHFFEIFKYYKKPDLEEVLKEVYLKLDVPICDKLMVDNKVAFQEFKRIQAKYLSVANSSRKMDECICFLRHNYVKRQKRLLNEVSDREHKEITPSAHTVFTHSSRLVQNYSIGLLNFTESGIEAHKSI